MIYDVTIVATVRKTICVEAESEDEAIEAAHEKFNILEDGTLEEYEQNVQSVWKIKDDNV